MSLVAPAVAGDSPEIRGGGASLDVTVPWTGDGFRPIDEPLPNQPWRVARFHVSDVTTGGQPQFSEDRQWWWTGTSWVPAASVSSPSLLTTSAWASLGLALLSYVLLPTPFLLVVPVTSIFAINIGRAALNSLPKTSTRDRRIAGIGIILAILPLALIILGIIALMLFMGYVMVTGNHSVSL
jgi:hypothetical protein